jgi:RNA polymerase-binding transcription factor DksA
MTSELCRIKNKLEEHRGVLLQRLSRVKQGITQEHSTDWSEQAQERQNDEVLEALGNELQYELKEINITLERINSGDYFNCTACGKEISLQRLEAIPYTPLCIHCAE